MTSPGQQPRLGATFYPGGIDDFDMPELVAPFPQRVMPEVPSNMQEGLAHLELEAHGSDRRDPRASSSPRRQLSSLPQRDSSLQPQSLKPAVRGRTTSYEHTNASAYLNAHNDESIQPQYSGDHGQPRSAQSTSQMPSPFPRIRDAGPNIPPSEEEKEEVLERARPLVLNSNDPEMQLAWAQDALVWVDTAISNRTRLSSEDSTRSSTPEIERQLRVDAISIISFLAEQQHPKALFLRGTWHEFGKFGCPVDRKEALHEYRTAGEKGYARAEYRIGTQYEGMKDIVKAIKHYNKGVSMGDAASTYRIGMMTLLGQHDQRQDFRLGIEQIKFAAEMADENAPQGAYIYGMLLARNVPSISIPDANLPYDIEQAKQFIEKAAYLGFAKAQQKMGQAYELCLLGCDFNPALSLHYNALAAWQGEPEADIAISKWFLCGFDGVFEKNEELAFTYAQRAAKEGLATAEFAMGYFYEIGMYVAIDLQQAQAWYHLAADHGNKEAGPRLQGISQQKTLSRKDHEQIAITRIKSQYGSRKGVRPDRFKGKPTPMPAMSEDVLDMPDHARHPLTGAETAPLSTSRITRPKSTAPYPEDDVAPDPRYGQRSISAAPQTRLQPLTGGPGRPSSAFGIRSLDAPQGMRLSSSMGNVASTLDSRSSDSANRQSAARRMSPNRGPPSSQSPIENNRNRLQKQAASMDAPLKIKLGHPALAPSHPPKTQQNHNSRPLSTMQPPYNDYPTQPAPLGYGRSSSPQRPQQPQQSYVSRANVPPSGGQRSDRFDSMPPNTGHAGQQRPQTSIIATAGQGIPPRTPSATPSTTSTMSTMSAPARPMKEGPKTFDEMGIHQVKDESDCCVM
ncbi:MAG: hypothetical protein M1818_004416 [Claussenomyces sp. TS43310]|nr:MAG: hypothetical protein M1818_004416 [Claussenomyces sp. TS43310]